MRKGKILGLALVLANWSDARATETAECKTVVHTRPAMYSETCLHIGTADTIFTLDILLTEADLEEEDIIVDIPYPNLRYAGAILQIYYSGPLGKSQWIPISNYTGVYLMPDALLLPVRRWIENGLALDTHIRITLLLSIN